MRRRLAAILAADVVGYSRLMGIDEAGTHRRLAELQSSQLEPLIEAHRGRIVKLMGDGLLVEFASIVDAVECALAWQEEVPREQTDLPEDQKLTFRIGINLGDVIVAEGDLHGEGVNVAARLEGLAEPGGICLSEDAVRQARGKVKASFEDLGAREVKNIQDPIRVFRAFRGSVAQAAEADGKGTRPRPAAASEKLSIAVLPFVNMTGDREQDYFSDGITEDIMTELSRFAVLQVIARHSSFALKGEKADVQSLGHRLGAQYVAEGSVRRAGNRVRITAQLSETESGTQIWAERFDRELEDIFALQDEVTRAIVGVLPGRVQTAVAERASRKKTDNMTAYELLLHGKAVRDSFNAEATARARPFFEQAIALDPRYAKAHAYLADTYFMDLTMGIAEDEAPQKSLQHAREAMSLDPRDVANHDQIGFAYIGAGLWEEADSMFTKAAGKVVTEAEPMTWIGYGLLMLGHAEEARRMVLEAKALDPLHPRSFDWVLGQACFFAKRFEEVLEALTGEALLNSFAYACLTGANAFLGRSDAANTALENFVAARCEEFESRGKPAPELSVAAMAESYFKVWRKQEDHILLAEGLKKAGLPD